VEKSEALEFVVPRKDGTTGTRPLIIYYKLRQFFWDVFLVRTDYLELEYEQSWFWPDVRKTIVQREIPVRRPLFRIEYFAPYQDFSFAFDHYIPEVESGDIVSSAPLETKCPAVSATPKLSLEQLAKVTFPVSRTEKKTAKKQKQDYAESARRAAASRGGGAGARASTKSASGSSGSRSGGSSSRSGGSSGGSRNSRSGSSSGGRSSQSRGNSGSKSSGGSSGSKR
jgi:hypothetical protein